MKTLACALALSACLGPAGNAGATYQNTLVLHDAQGRVANVADPFALRFNGLYYLYSTGAEEVGVFVSRDLVHCTFAGHCTQGGGLKHAFAPEVVYWRGDFYMITSPRGDGHYILRSESPLGPFELITENFGYSIDGSFYVEDDGRLMILYADDGSIGQAYLDEKTMLPDGIRFSTGVGLNGWTEGASILRRGDWHYMTFTGNHFLSTGYRIAYASRKGAPRGRYVQREDCTLMIHSVFGDAFAGIGHNGDVVGPDLESWYATYHTHAKAADGGFMRQYNLDRLLTNGGLLYTTGATNFEMPTPAMPDLYGDAAKGGGDFAQSAEGYFAEAGGDQYFTQECNFAVEGGEAVWLLGSRAGIPVTLSTDGRALTLRAGGEALARARVPELGEAGRLHALRVENTPEVFYAYIDGMRLIALEKPGFEADTIGAYAGEGVRYAFLAHTGEALGSGDCEAVKVFPGAFAAIHAKDGHSLASATVGAQEERAAVLGEARYALRVAQDGAYCLRFTVRPEDAGKTIKVSVGEEPLAEVTVPEYAGKATELFTFTADPVEMKAGEQELVLRADGVTLNTVAGFVWTQVERASWDFAQAQKGFVTLGPFSQDSEAGALRIKPGRQGFALFGGEGYTDYEVRARFVLPEEGSGTSGIMVRARDVSLYEHQVKESFYGYALTVSRLGVSLRRVLYGAAGSAQFVAVPQWAQAEEGELIVRVEGSAVSVYLPEVEQPLLEFVDPAPFASGLAGFFSTGKEWQARSFAIAPIDAEG